MGKKRARTVEEMEQDERQGMQLKPQQQQLLRNALSRLDPRMAKIAMEKMNEEHRVRCVR